MQQYRLFFLVSLLLLFLSTNLNAQKIKVFVLAGQSNMQGHGEINPVTTNGTLSNFIANDASGLFDYTQNIDGSWATRDDVWVRYDHDNENLLADVLGVGYGGYEGQIGPELGFGQELGEYSEDKVLLIKTCWGGKSLAIDFRPPSSGGIVGPYYTQIISDVTAAIDQIEQEFTTYDGEDIEIAGFCWFQGWNDGEEMAYLDEYEENMKNLIADVRVDLNVPDLPVVIGLTGNGGNEISQVDTWLQSLQTILVPAQISAAEFTGHTNVTYADTRDFWREGDLSPEPDFVHHWNNNAESYLRIGHEMGRKMIELLTLTSTSTSPADANFAIKLFPSPTNGYFQLESEGRIMNLKILDVNGRIVHTLKKVLPLEEIDISGLSEGLYFVEILNKKNVRISIQKVVKQ